MKTTYKISTQRLGFYEQLAKNMSDDIYKEIIKDLLKLIKKGP